MAASLHVLAALPGDVLLEYDRSENPIREAMMDERLGVRQDGTVVVPDDPGLGLRLQSLPEGTS